MYPWMWFAVAMYAITTVGAVAASAVNKRYEIFKLEEQRLGRESLTMSMGGKGSVN